MKFEDTNAKITNLNTFMQDVMTEELNSISSNIHNAQKMTTEIMDNYRDVKDFTGMFQANANALKTIFEKSAENFEAQNTKMTERTHKLMNIFTK